ncbi:MAG: hypothetical protein GDA52_07885 [Rhodobacteraceae bacterium]|nr:hypothetical protein [Paracoccaceae bacterium]
MSKYTPLADYLRNQTTQRLTLTFRQIEGILGCPLPPSAYKHRPWWANEAEGNHVQTAGWLAAGWQTADVDMRGQNVTFVRLIA